MLAAIVRVKLHSLVKHILRRATGPELFWMIPAVKMMAAYRANGIFNVNQNVASFRDWRVSHWTRCPMCPAHRQTQAFDRFHHHRVRAQSVQRAAFPAMWAKHHQVSKVGSFPPRAETIDAPKFDRCCFFCCRLETNMNIGDRVIVSSGMGSRAGILQYIGETQFAPGNWCGVQLDEPTGKNDGTVDGVQYVLSHITHTKWWLRYHFLSHHRPTGFLLFSLFYSL